MVRLRVSSRWEAIRQQLPLAAAIPTTIRGVLEECCPRYRSKVAYRMKEGEAFRTLSYGELQQQASEFAAGLIALGLRQGDRVAIICENGFEWVIGYYGQSIAGGVGVPLYTELKAPEMEEMVRHAEARFVIASARVLRRLRGDIPGVAKIIGVGDGLEAKDDEDSG